MWLSRQTAIPTRTSPEMSFGSSMSRSGEAAGFSLGIADAMKLQVVIVSKGQEEQ